MLIAQISDLHVCPPGQLAYGVSETNAFAEKAVHALLRLRLQPDMVLLTGDATESGQAAEYDLLLEWLNRLPMPVYVIPGNHDHREAMRTAFKPRGYMPRGGHINYTVESRPVRVVALDSLLEGQSHGVLTPATLDFLEWTLEAHRDVPTLVCLHHPPMPCGIGHMDKIRLTEGVARLAAILGDNPQVERLLTGHHHRAIQARFAGTICQVAPSVAHQVSLDLRSDASSCFDLEPPQFLLHHWIAGTGVVTHCAFVDRAAGPFPLFPEAGPDAC